MPENGARERLGQFGAWSQKLNMLIEYLWNIRAGGARSLVKRPDIERSDLRLRRRARRQPRARVEQGLSLFDGVARPPFPGSQR